MAIHPDTPRSLGDHGAAHTSPVTPAEDFRTVLINKVSWGAVAAGVVVALVAHLILNLLGLGIGLATLDPATGESPDMATSAIATAVWVLLAGVIAAFAGGFASGRLSGKPKESTAGWNGLISWAATTLILAYMVGSAAGGLFGTTMRTVATVAGGTSTAAVAAVAGTAASPEATATVDQQLRAQTGITLPQSQTVTDAAVAAMRAAVTANPADAEAAKTQAAAALAQSQNISLTEARTQVEGALIQMNAAVPAIRQQAAEVAEGAAEVGSNAALLAVVALILGGVAAWFGGRAGAVDPTVTSAGLAFAGTRTTTVTGRPMTA